jgi:hypothetical protein
MHLEVDDFVGDALMDKADELGVTPRELATGLLDSMLHVSAGCLRRLMDRAKRERDLLGRINKALGSIASAISPVAELLNPDGVTYGGKGNGHDDPA